MKIFYHLTVGVLILFLLAACDKHGNPLPSDLKFIAVLNGVKYKDELPMFLPPGVQRTPVMQIVSADTGYLNLRSLLKTEDENDIHGNFSLKIRIPTIEPIQVNKKYSFSPIPGKEVLFGIESLIYLEGAKQFVSVSSTYFNLDLRYFGTGTLVFTSYDLEKNRAKGKVDFVLPYDIWDSESKDLKLTGEFYCWINNPN